MKRIQLGDIVSGRVRAVLPAADNSNMAGILTIALSDGGEGIVNIDEVPYALNSENNARFISRRYMGRKVIAKVIQLDPTLLSIKDAVNERLPDVKVEVGEVITGTVVYVNRKQAEIEYKGCLKMIMPSSEFGLIRIGDLSRVLNPGTDIQVEVLEANDENIIVSHKKFASDPWPEIQAKYRARGQYLGRVAKIINIGIFVTLEPGLDVLASPKPSFFDVFLDDEVALEITDIEPQNGKIKGIITALVSSNPRNKKLI